MGIPPASKPSTYVPPRNGVGPTLLNSSAQPEAGQYDDLNRSPATTIELRFSPVQTGTDQTTVGHHGYIVVTDNISGKQWKSEAGPTGQRVRGLLPSGFLEAHTREKGDTVKDPTQAATFTTDVPAEEVAARLTKFSDAFSQRKVPYRLPDYLLPGVPESYLRDPPPSTTTSNYYAGAAWEHLTGSLPRLPSGVFAPGWGEHKFDTDSPP
ncbi:MAG TPA: hypothetical protein VMI56_25685 [Reyranella sp.]|nr:hypothetical protein [Reyranella sp.]